ncbi:serine/threonine-protein kinase [Streptomyces sp. NPDC005336]|uniref:serine/threonine-protein kinase n=1 Tax=Streptomyces sp. NPDC005336 TaxID=3157035 RepID=UPI0033BD16FC
MQPLHGEDPDVLGAYRLLARLGAGGMGRVYLARSPGGRTVAVKVVRPELAEDEEFRARFRHEVGIARAVSGPYTAPVVDADTEAVLPWLATAYVLGPCLDEVIAAHGPLPEASVRALGAGLASALEVIHGAGLVHRDLKPSNVLLAADGPRVIDFGIARAVDGARMTSTGIVVGSPGFIPPEQASGQVAGPQGDVFSLGVVLAYAATGELAFGHGSAAGTLYRVVHGEADVSNVPEALRPLVTACLAKDPQARPRPEEMKAALAGEGMPSVVDNWLPGPVASTIARHATRILDLDTPLRNDVGSAVRTPTAVDQCIATSPTQTSQPQSQSQPNSRASAPAAASSRRRFLALGAGAGVLAVGGGVAWAFTGGGRKETPAENTSESATGLAPENFTTPPAGTSPKLLWHAKVKPLSLEYAVRPRVIGNLMVLSGDPLVAHNVVTGKRKWASPGMAGPGAQLIHSAGLLFFRSPKYDGDFIGINPATGKEAWRSRLGGKYDQPEPIAADSKRVFVIAQVLDEDPTKTLTVIAAVDIKTREVVWNEPRSNGSGDTDVVATTDGQHIVYTDDLHNLTVRRAADGEQLWTRPVGEDLAYRPVIHRDKVVIGGASMRAFGLKNGHARWSLPSGHKNPFDHESLTLEGDTIYAAVQNGGVWAVDASSGKKLWKSTDLGRRPAPKEFVSVGGSVYAATFFESGGVYAFDAKNGKLRWTYIDGVHDDGEWHVVAAGRRLVVTHTDRLYGLPAV